jgi:hypothetical protein
MWWVFIKYVKIMAMSVAVAFIFSANVSAWSSSTPPDFKDSEIKTLQPYPCQGNFETITLNGSEVPNACVMGSSTKVAWFVPNNGIVTYAISFAYGNNFYFLNICQGVMGCVYADETDTLVGFSGIRRNFASNLIKTNTDGVIHYTPRADASVFSVSRFNERDFVTQTLALSKNGKWALIELRDYGIFRINTETLKVRRVIAPGVSYGYGSDPRIEMTISNDGTLVAVVGTRMSIALIKIDESCGDLPTVPMQPNYTDNTVPCLAIPTPTSKYIQDFKHAVRPVFSGDGKRLSFDAFSYTASGRHFTLFPDSNESRADPVYLALGDSFTSGEGELSDSYYLGGANDRCHVSSRSYPFLLGELWGISTHSTACSGATMQTANGNAARSNQPNQIQELELRAPYVSTLGIGGNDAGLIGKLKDCLGIDTCSWANNPQSRYQTAMEIKSLFPHLKNFYVDTKMKTLGPVIVIGYPRIISSQAGCSSMIGTLLNETERAFMNQAIHYLNQVMQAAARNVGIEYADIQGALSGGELCTSFESPLVNAIRFGDDYPDITALPYIKIVGAESFHPKPAGHEKITQRIHASFPDLFNIGVYINSGNPTQVPSPSAYWSAQGANLKPQKSFPFISKVTIKKKDFFDISFPALTFKPGSDVTLELHSDVKNLGVFQAAADGSFNHTVSSADFEAGFHSVHSIGKDFADNDIDIYDFLEVYDEGAQVAGFSNSEQPTASTTNLSNVVASQSLPSQSTLPPTAQSNNQAYVLGSSTANVPNIQLFKVLQREHTKPIQGLSNINNIRNSIVIAALILIVIAVVTAIYHFNRIKTPS